MMDESVKQVLASYELGLNSYKEKLGEDNQKLKKAVEIFSKLNKVAESAKDMMDFYSKPDASALLGDLGAAMSELSAEKPIHGLRTAPPASQAAAGYHVAYNNIPANRVRTKKIYERVFELEKSSENAAVFSRLMAEEGMYLKMSAIPLLESFEGQLENAENLSQPVMANYYRKIQAKVPAARSIAELEYGTNLEAEVSIYQNLYDNLLLGITSNMLGDAISSYMLVADEDNRQYVEYSARFLAEYFGLDFTGLYSVPRIRDHFEKVIYNTVKKDLANRGINSVEQFLQTEKAVVDQCLQGRPPLAMGPEKYKKLPLWDKEAPLADIVQGYQTFFQG